MALLHNSSKWLILLDFLHLTQNCNPLKSLHFYGIMQQRHEQLEDFPEWQRENIKLAGEILESDEYLQLPDKFEINEYHIMEEFCLSINDEGLRERMYYSIKGSGAFRRFKENIRKYGIEDDWYRFRDAKIKEIATEWCEYHKIPFIDQ
jgi:Uncharacterised protein family (UPF0158).